MTNLLGSVNTNAPLIKTAFEKVMTNLEKQVQNMKIKVEGITIDIPASAFSFANTKATVPATIFDFSAVRSAAGAIDSLVEQINTYSYSKTKRTTSRGAMSVGRSRNSLLAKSIKPIWSDEYEASENSEVYGASTLKMPIPSVSISGTSASSPSSSPSSSSSPSPASKNASKGGGDNGVTVNIYDGTGQKISAYDSGIRVEITERASRNNQFAALL